MTNEITIPAGKMEWETWCEHRERMSFKGSYPLLRDPTWLVDSTGEDVDGLELLEGNFFPITFKRPFSYTVFAPVDHREDALQGANFEIDRLRALCNKTLHLLDKSKLEIDYLRRLSEYEDDPDHITRGMEDIDPLDRFEGDPADCAFKPRYFVKLDGKGAPKKAHTTREKALSELERLAEQEGVGGWVVTDRVDAENQLVVTRRSLGVEEHE